LNNICQKYLVCLICLLALVFLSCEKEITVEVPEVESKIVVEGTIFNDQPPLIFLTWSQGYFEPTDLNSLNNLFVRNAIVKIETGGQTFILDQICTDQMTPEQLEFAATLFGLTAAELQALPICAYTSVSAILTNCGSGLCGVSGESYKLIVDHESHHLESLTRINELVVLDSLWFDIISSQPNDSLGFIFGTITDPDTIGNAYRWFARRINHYPDWDNENAGQQKDNTYIAPIGSVFDDEFFNGLSFEFAYYRGTFPNSSKEDDNNIERGFFKTGDTVAIRGCTIDKAAFNFINSLEDQAASQGSPFALPFDLESNVAGGLGAFIGYGAVYDTVICQP
jgi:Domain of unknown function (DUF4249)